MERYLPPYKVFFLVYSIHSPTTQWTPASQPAIQSPNHTLHYPPRTEQNVDIKRTNRTEKNSHAMQSSRAILVEFDHSGRYEYHRWQDTRRNENNIKPSNKWNKLFYIGKDGMAEIYIAQAAPSVRPPSNKQVSAVSIYIRFYSVCVSVCFVAWTKSTTYKEYG